ncbi:MAG: aminotransferase class V-fold PLP-dependent enzyme [Planctomycetota bacterium]
MNEEELVYFDCAATTPLDARVLEAMAPYWTTAFGNAASPHALGRRASAAVEHARGELALALGADPREIVFTSGATEANNLALKGVAAAPAHARAPRRIITAVTEHHAVLDPLAGLAQSGFEIVRLGVDSDGHINLIELERELARGALLVSLMSANNETGVLHPLAQIGALCRANGALFHTDATQSFGKSPIEVDALGVDLCRSLPIRRTDQRGRGALSAPQAAAGARRRANGGRRARGRPPLGDAQRPGDRRARRGGRLGSAAGPLELARVAQLRDRFEAALSARVAGVTRNGDPAARLPGHANVSFAGCDGESLLRRMPALCASTAAACTSASRQPSHVLRAMGLAPERVLGSVRFSLGLSSTEREVALALEWLVHAVGLERAQGPTASC